MTKNLFYDSWPSSWAKKIYYFVKKIFFTHHNKSNSLQKKKKKKILCHPFLYLINYKNLASDKVE